MSATRMGVIVVGATGFLGTVLVQHLFQRTNWTVVLLLRRPVPGASGDGSQPVVHSYLENLCRQMGSTNTTAADQQQQQALLSTLQQRVHVVESEGSAVSAQDLERAVHFQSQVSVTGIFHVAGLVKHTNREEDVAAMHVANIQLSDTVFNFAKNFGLHMVYASSSGVVGCQDLAHRNSFASDDAPFCTQASAAFPYYQQKIAVEDKWRHQAQRGEVSAVFLRPSLLLGPGDTRLSSCQVIFDLMKQRLPFLVPGGVSAVDVRDVAQAFVIAMEKLQSGGIQSGLAVNLTARNCEFKTFAAEVAGLAKVKLPWITLPAFASRIGARILTQGRSCLGLAYDPSVDPVFAEMGLRFWNVKCELAEATLNFYPRSMESTILNTVDYLRSNPQIGAPPVVSPSGTGAPRKQQRALWCTGGVLVVLVVIVILLRVSL